jgi:TRAP-type mannitol/chloroaromatic compound transport system permease small subunit
LDYGGWSWPARGQDEGQEKTKWAGTPADWEGDLSGLDALIKALLPVSRGIDAVTTWLGKRVSWLILAAVVVSAANAVVRKIFDTSSNSWLELQWVLFSMVFLLCAPWTLSVNEHIRIDILNNSFPQRVRNIIDVIGHSVFLLPLTIIMVITAIPFFTKSFYLNEQSFSAGGLPQWPAKALVMIGFGLLFAQGISELIKRIAVMRGLIPDPYETSGGLKAAVEAEAARLLAELKTDAPTEPRTVRE